MKSGKESDQEWQEEKVRHINRKKAVFFILVVYFFLLLKISKDLKVSKNYMRLKI